MFMKFTAVVMTIDSMFEYTAMFHSGCPLYSVQQGRPGSDTFSFNVCSSFLALCLLNADIIFHAHPLQIRVVLKYTTYSV